MIQLRETQLLRVWRWTSELFYNVLSAVASQSGNCRASPAATQHDWTWVRVLPWACASPTHYKAVAMMLAHSGTAQPKARKQGCQRAVPLDCGYAYSWPPGAPEAEACLHSRSIRVSKQSLCCLG